MALDIAKAVKWVGKTVLLVEAFGRSGRPIAAWLNGNRQHLAATAFESREAVRQRITYVDLGGEEVIRDSLEQRGGLLLWLWGAGGTGKSTLAFELARRANAADCFIPVLVDFGWRGSLESYVATCIGEVGTSGFLPAEVVSRMLASGAIGLVVDGLSELQRAGAVEELEETARSGRVRNLVVTSRSPSPSEHFTAKKLGNLDHGALRDLAATYVPDRPQLEAALDAIESFAHLRGISPLFARIALRRFMEAGQLPSGLLELAQEYLLSLRKPAASAPTEEDLLRACRIAAFACLESSFTPHAVDEPYLRGLLDSEASRSAFVTDNYEKLTGAQLIQQLVQYGLLHTRVVNAMHRIDFVHHPLAEQLAAAHYASLPERARDALLQDIEKSDAAPGFKQALRALGLPGAWPEASLH
ncbi:hypothetical protein LMG27952_04909 [Paraburkholderia hiiakae]|uniref:NB-ARC domain-containing protein n=1 Tax=Paraburkholderia hiiakae TaxID=1081782 RepID=A0ABM8NYR0_9BURK|nr:hypothetical protein [Paraburkholderia hiiakae]CAD6549768.1 hypothetical protein LMG27952_04909 [Paraburkholderia hiiakae]